MKRLILVPLLALTFFIGLAVGPGDSVADSCAAGFVQDAAACGSTGPTNVHLYDYNCSQRWEPPVTLQGQTSTYAMWCNNNHIGLHQHNNM
jgi:hypothetical protein